MTTVYDPRRTPRLIMATALDDDMHTAVHLIEELASDPKTAAEAMLNFGELLNLTLSSLAGATDRTIQDVWREIAVDHAANDDTWDAEKGAQFDLPAGAVCSACGSDDRACPWCKTKTPAVIRVDGQLLVSQTSLDEAKRMVNAKVASGELVRLPGGRVIEASEYDPEKHGHAASRQGELTMTDLPTLAEWTLPVIEEVRKARPELTFEQARDLVYEREWAARKRGEVAELPDGTLARTSKEN